MSSFFLFVTANLKKRSFIAMIIFCFVTFLFLSYFIAFIWSAEDPAMKIFENYFSFPVVYNSIAIFQLYPSILFGVLIIMLISSGFEEDTFKILLMNGITKKSLWQNTILLCWVLATLLFFLSIPIAFNIGYIKSQFTFDFSFTGFYWLCIYYFQTFMFFLYAVIIALVFKHSGTAIFVYLVLFLQAERWLAYIIDITFNLYPTCRFLPGKVVEDLTYMDPNPRFVIQYLDVQDQRWVFACFYLVLSIAIIGLLFKKANYTK